MSQPYIVSGATAGDHGIVGTRHEIRDLQMQHPIQFSLFIQALSRVMGISKDTSDNVPKAHPESWEQMGGIHGMPYVRWNGDPNASSTPVKPTDWKGYCHHESILFPTWHRVVMLLVEQAIFNQAQLIVAALDPGLPHTEKWINEAKCLRYPYWDWTTPDTLFNGLPSMFQTDDIGILVPGQELEQTVPNPLASYPLQGLNKTAPFPDRPFQKAYFNKWDRTCRVPQFKPAAQDDYVLLNQHIREGGTFFYENNGTQAQFTYPGWNHVVNVVGQLFTYPLELPQNQLGNAWGTFANTGKIVPPPTGMSGEPTGLKGATIESPHNTMHLILGGQGHMGDNDFAAFDPIFYLHHCNIDRIYAFWEYLYPNYWMDQGYTDKDGNPAKFIATDGTFTQVKGKPYDNKTELAPFRRTGTKYWDSEEVRGLTPDVQKKFYTYPPIVSADHRISVQVDQPITSAEEREMYLCILTEHWGYNPAKEVAELPGTLKAPFFRRPHQPVTGLPATHTILGHYRLFTMSIQVNPFAFDGSHLVEVFLHAYPDVVVGVHAVLSRSDPTLCENCVARAAQGSLSISRIVIPAIFIYGILEMKKVNREDATDEQVLDAITSSFGARIVTPSRQRLAEAHPAGTLEDGPLRSLPRLEESKAPELNVYSAYVGYPTTKTDGAIQHAGWAEHGTILDREWRTMPVETASA